MSSPRTRTPETLAAQTLPKDTFRSTKNVAAQRFGLRTRLYDPSAKPTRTDFLERLTVKAALG